MAKIIHNGVEYGGSGYSKNEIDRKLGLKLNKSSIDTEISEDSSNPVQNRVIAKAFKESQAIINVEELPTTNIKNTFYRFGYKGESQYIDVDALSEPNLERFDIVKQRFENAGFTVELKPDSSVHPKYTVTYPSEIYAYITPTVGYLIPTRIELVDVTNTQDQHEPELVVYYMQGTSETYTLRRANSPSVGSIFEYAESASPSLYAGNAEEQTVTKLDDGQSFIGTKAEWDALSQQEKNKYDGKIVNITDDEGSTESIKEYIRNQNVLSEPEAVSLSNKQYVMEYDGIFTFSIYAYNASQRVKVSINNILVINASLINYPAGQAYNSYTVHANKGDTITIDTTINLFDIITAQYYKLRDYTGR